jgi:DNA topoisomerase-2
MSAAAAPATETYKKHTHREHILELPDTYIGSTEQSEEQRWVFDTDTNKMTWRTVSFNQGLYKIFDEIIVNARDAFVRAQESSGSRLPIKSIDVSVGFGDKGNMIISVENDGDGIPIEEHPTEKVYIPELIFGHLLTSSNYNKAEEKIVGGKNGYGIKLGNIFSTRFTMETKHPASGKTYTQTWRKNMSICEKPIIKKSTGAKGYVKIELEPDLTRFHGSGPEMIPCFQTRTIELAALVGPGVKVTWNGEHIVTNTFEKYIKLFLRDGMAGLGYENCGPRWEVGAVLTSHLYSDEEGLPDEKHISFVNGILTKKGGKHVEAVARNVLKDFCDAAEKKKVAIKPAQLKDAIVFFVNATIVNPSFDSQTKEFLTTPANKFGSSPKFSGKLTDTLIKLGLLDEAKYLLEAKAMKDAKKTDGKKRTTLRGLPKLEDALWAGTAKSAECTLILTEGDSAASSAIAGLNVVGREKWGVFPLRGKLLNVKDITIQKFNANEELTAIKRILGLEHGRSYKSLNELRYGRVMIMTDQDHDGSHIKGLLMNLFHTEWPTLLSAGFLCTLKTPLLKASKGKEVVSFYADAEYRTWMAARGGDTKGWHIKYYKGLGTSTPVEAREWFKDLHEIKYEWDEEADESINLAFNKKRADDRKKWLNHYDPDRVLDEVDGKTAYSSFIHNELIHFSNADNIRSLPNLMDGLKPSQRKILYCCFKRNLRSEIKVAQLSGYVSEHASYHHGEASLNSTITGMAQNFVGSNNVNILKPIGQFGSRLLGGKDAASPRYIHTELENIVDTIFRKEDNILLNYLVEDGDRIEPSYYLPTVPLLVLNGAVGIGTGYSTDIPPYNPTDIITLLKHRLMGGIATLAGRPLDPWWFGFTGKVSRSNENTWITHGVYEMDETKHTITITELPVGMWTKDYKAFLDDLLTREGSNPYGLRNFDDLYNDVEVKFILYMTEEGWDAAAAAPAEFEKNFKLTTSWKTTNMCCFDAEFTIKKYDTVGDIIEAFVEQRLPAYEVRRTKQLEVLRKEVSELQAKRAFLQAILDGKLDLMRRTDEEIVANLKACGIPALSDPGAADSVDGYEYVLRLRIDRVKQSAILELDKQVADRCGQMEVLEKQTPANMWLSDLEDFEAAWKKYVGERNTALMEGTVATEGKIKKVARRKPAAGGAGRG